MTFSDAFAVNSVTVYSASVDEWGAPSYVRLGVIKCEYMQGGSMQRDDSGTEFVPMSTFYPVDSSIEIKKGYMIALGSFDDLTVPSGAEEVRKVSISSDDYFGRGRDIEVFTG